MNFLKKALLSTLITSICSVAAASENEVEKFTLKQAIAASGMEAYDTDRNNELIQNANKSEPELQRDLGENYGGTWIDYDENNNAFQVIATTKPVNLEKQAYVNKSTQFKIAKYGYPLLRRIQEEAADTLLYAYDSNNKQLIQSIDIDIPKNTIVVNASEKNFPKVISILKDQSFDLNMFELRVQEDSGVETGDLYGGTRITYGLPNTSPGTWGGPLCTAGFNAFADGIYPVVLTAGHCNKNLALSHVFFNIAPSGQYSNSGDYIGQFLANKYKEGVDAVLFGNTGNHNTHSAAILSPNSSVQYNDVIQVTSALVNTRVCGFGGTSGWRCAKLSSIDQLRNRPDAPRSFRLAIVDFCSLIGDSGGPVLSATNNAIGLLSSTENSSGTNCASVGGTLRTAFQTLTPYFAKVNNVKLLLNKP